MNSRSLTCFVLLLAAAGESLAKPSEVWDFKVYLDEAPVGYHRFSLNQRPAGRELHSEARFDVRFLFFKAYTYIHQATESWKGDCVENLHADTDDNGEVTKLSGRREGKAFQLSAPKGISQLPECVMTFAYWHPDMLKQKFLLNPQTGEYTEVRITPQGTETVPVNGRPVPANRYSLDAGKFQIDLWYGAEDQRWLALDSKLEGGRLLRYRLESGGENP